MNPLPRWTGGPSGQQDQGHGEVLHVQGEGYQTPKTFNHEKSLSMTPLTPWSLTLLYRRSSVETILTHYVHLIGLLHIISVS